MGKVSMVRFCQAVSVLVVSGFADASVITALYLAGLPIVYGQIAGFMAMGLTCLVLHPETVGQLTGGPSSGFLRKMVLPVVFVALLLIRGSLLLTLTHMGQSAFLSSVFIADGTIILFYLSGLNLLKQEKLSHRQINVG